MKFNEILNIGIDNSKLEPTYWKRIDTLASKRVNLQKESLEILKELHDCDCLLVNFGVVVSKEMIDKAPNLKYIGVLATAFGKIDTQYAKTKNITVCSIPGYSTESVAEFCFGALLDYIRELEKGKKEASEKNYSGSGFTAIEIKNKTFGIIGLGNIGSRVAEIAQGFGANVIYWSRNRKSNFEAKGIKYENIDSLLSKSDIISLHLAQTKDTENFLNEEKFQKIKKEAIILNSAPMELVNIPALEKKLEKKEINFIFDHSDEMKQEDLDKLSKYKNCIIYPPIAYISKEATIAKQEIFTNNIENFLKGTPQNVVS